MDRRVVLAPDSFKGTLAAAEVCEALAEGLEVASVAVDRCPVADGGEGTIDALRMPLALELREFEVRDPRGLPVRAPVGFGAHGEIVIESALAIGLALVPEAERDPLKARSTGLGELVSLALREEPRELLVGVGGTATIDGGAGVLAAIEPDQIARTNVKILCDVGTAWSRAAAVYGPQKGADPDEVATLERRLDQLAGRLKRDPRARAATGAGGGISGAFWSLGAELVSGADTILDLVGIDRRLVGVDLVVTGEGRLDEQTAEGKLVARVVERAQRAGVRSVAVVGQVTAAAAPIKALGLEDIFVAGDSVALRLTGERIAAALARSGGGLHC